MAYCKGCGSTVDTYDQSCPTCGTPVSASQATIIPAGSTSTTHASSPVETNPVIGSWGYVGALLLLGFPVVGFIVSIVWAAGAVSNDNLRNLARAYLLILLLIFVLLFILAISIFARFGSLLYGLTYLINLFR